MDMATLESVEQAIQEFTQAQLAEFRKWFAEYDGENWDRQIENDAASGKLDALAAEALADVLDRDSCGI